MSECLLVASLRITSVPLSILIEELPEVLVPLAFYLWRSNEASVLVSMGTETELLMMSWIFTELFKSS
jgi:hypothetical protein